MDIVPIYKRVIGLDVHQAQITGCAITEQPDGSVTYERREFGGFKRDRKALAAYSGDRDRSFRSIVTGAAACGVAHLNCRGVGHDGSGLTSFLLVLGF